MESTIVRTTDSISTKTHEDRPAVQQSPDSLADELEAKLTARYGVLLSTQALIQVLGFPSLKAYQQAVARRTIPIPLFKLENRRGRFGLARDVAIWLVAQRQTAIAEQPDALSITDPSVDSALSIPARTGDLGTAEPRPGVGPAAKESPSGCL